VEVSHTPSTKTLTITMETNKTFLAEHLLNEDGEGLVEFLKVDKLHQVIDKFMTLCFPNIKNLVASFKHHPSNKGKIDNIITLKFKNVYDYI
jgi:hypothetical protein